MLKVTYKVKGTFSLKNKQDGHLLSRSHDVPTSSCIRGALLASAFKYKGREWAKSHFNKIKHSQIFIQYDDVFSKQQEKRKMITTRGVDTSKDFNPDGANALTTLGVREYVLRNEIVFYIDETLEDVTQLLENINRLGNTESLVELKSIEKSDTLTNVLMPTSIRKVDEEYVKDEEWHKNTKFNQVDAYGKGHRKSVTKFCKIDTLSLE